LLRRTDGKWDLQWLGYFAPLAGHDFIEPVFKRRVASSPEGLVDAPVESHVGGLGSSTTEPAAFDVTQILDGDDAVALAPVRPELGTVEARTLTQPAVSVAKDGERVYLMVVPSIVYEELPLARFEGCLAIEIVDVETAAVAREPGGTPAVRARIDAPFEGHYGPGMCDYDRRSSMGIIMVRMRDTREPDGSGTLRLTTHATGVVL